MGLWCLSVCVSMGLWCLSVCVSMGLWCLSVCVYGVMASVLCDREDEDEATEACRMS